MGALRRRVFKQYQRRFIPLVGLLVAAATYVVLNAALGYGWPLGALLFGGYLAVVFDRGILFGNGWLRRALRRRLRELGEWVDRGTDRFVGLAHPCRVGDLGRRLVESDDDVGFLTVSHRGVHYRGDALSFDIAAEAIEEVRLTRCLIAPWGRVEVVIRDGEPFDRLIFDSRQYASHALCRCDNLRLHDQLRGLRMAAGPLTSRLTSREPVAEVSLTA